MEETLSMDLLNAFDEDAIDITIEEDELEFNSPGDEPPANTSTDADPDPKGIFKGKQEGGGADNEEGEDPESSSSGEDTTDKDPGDKTSPNTPILASVALACYEDGIFPDLSEDEIKEIKDSESFAAALKKQIEAGLDAEQKRIRDMLNVGVEPDIIQQYEGAIQYLSGISEEELEAESDDAEALRKKIIYSDFINRGFKKERAQREVERSFNAGTDIEDAKAALESCLDFYKEEYSSVVEERKAKAAADKAAQEKRLKEFKAKVLNTEKPFDGINLDKGTREKVYNNMTKASYKDEAGNIMTPIQKYIKENSLDAHYYLSLMYTLTDGFKNIDKLVNQKLTKAKKGALRELEHKLSNTRTLDDGSVNFNMESEEASFDFIDRIDV
nr:MAG TPA: hypothetical protein [Crassvirales sp.]